MRTAPALIAVLAIAIALGPTAAAQLPELAASSVALRVKGPEDAVGTGSVVSLPLVVEYGYSMAAHSLEATTVRLHVVEAPFHVMATVSPATLSMPLQPTLNGLANRAYGSAVLTLVVGEDAPQDSILVRVRAVAERNGYIGGSEAVEDVILLLKRPLLDGKPDEACVSSHDADLEEGGELLTQSSGMAAASPIPVAGLGLAGSVLGIALAWRRFRP
ncbi:MAG TPA: hypothetical protein VM889_04320 [Candidatus Thermoplasmatota archaeon]|nr:hypothetical protein [Candidatus Thermoplasmatota archaeon]